MITRSNYKVTCPYCGAVSGGTWNVEAPEYSEVERCSECHQIFVVSVKCSVTINIDTKTVQGCKKVRGKRK